MTMTLRRLQLLVPICVGLLACTGNDVTVAKTGGDAACSEPRPTICPKIRRPVCATRDNGVRCVTTPCESTEEVTYPNGCLACADPAVYTYREGACE